MKRIVVLLLLAFIIFASGIPTAQASVVVVAADPASAPADLPAVTETGDQGALTANSWLWVSFTDPLEQFEVKEPESYTLTFNEDSGAAPGASGTVAIVADCNNASGSYTEDGGSLTIEIGPVTLAACPEGSRSDQFVALLGGAARYFFEDAMLYIDLLADGGTMVFAPEGEEALAEASTEPATEPTIDEAETAGVTLVCSAGNWATDCADGPRAITGEAGSGNFALLPDLFPSPTAALIDVTNVLRGEPEVFVPESGQILGIFTDPLFPLPAEVRMNLPIVPTGASLDLDNNGQTDAGVQVYALTVASNIINDSYLQQLEQAAGMMSHIRDSQTGAITEGIFLVYAPDAEQGFPAGTGEDGLWFTPDDPSITLPAGYTVATLDADGTVTLDRSPEVAIDTIEAAEQVSPDFGDQGLLESYNSLIDVLAERYAYTELRNLDWEEIRDEYLPQVEQADADQDLGAYFLALDTLAKSLHDSHVAATNYDPEASLEPLKSYLAQVGASVGASTFAAIDESTPAEAVGDKILVLAVGEDSPAAEAGWVPGTEIVSIDSEPASERLETIPLLKSVGTEAVRRVMQAKAILNFAEGQTVTIGYRLPGTTEVLTATMVAGDYDRGTTSPPAQSTTPVTYEQRDDYAIVRWSSFIDYVLPKIAVLEEALAVERGRESGGVILDLRGNSGGWLTLYETMVSYFFTESEPMPTNVFDWYTYDLETGEHVRSYAADYMLSAPRPELAYTGPVAVLVDESCASACEYFTQHLQVLGRATVIGQFPTSGAGGPIERVKLPGGTTFQFTKGGTYFAGTDEPNLEAKGVVPDIQVPVTLETEQAKVEGEDPVMEAALAAMPEITARHTAEMLRRGTWQWSAVADGSAELSPVEDPASYTITFAAETLTVQADCNQATGTYTLGEAGTLSIELDAATVAECQEGSRSEEFLAYLGAVAAYQLSGGQLLLVLDSESGAAALLFDRSAEAEPTTGVEEAHALTINPWQWVSFTDPLQQFEVEMPESYTLTFNEDAGAATGASGTAAIVADCNNASGTYTEDAGSLKIEIGPMTLAACPEGSRSDQFVALLGGTARYFFEEDFLHIDLMVDGGTMVFAPADGEAAAVGGEGALASADTFDPEAEPILGTLAGGGNDGVWLDPTLVSVKSGVLHGPVVDASQLGAGCAGNIPAQPDVVMNWKTDDDVEMLRIFFLSGGDPTMVVVTPSGDVLCSDDLNPRVLDPYLEIPNPPAGRYAVFVGSFENDATEPGFLVFTGHDLNPATLDVAQLVPREIDPAALGEPIAVDVLDTLGTPAEVGAADIPLRQEMVGGGDLEAFNIELDNHLCTGFISAAPTFSFEWSGEAEKLVLFFEGDVDSTLVVRTPAGAYACDDDVHGALNLNPALELDPVAGTYHVWVGSFAADTPVNGTLTIAGAPGLEPEPLTAGKSNP